MGSTSVTSPPRLLLRMMSGNRKCSGSRAGFTMPVELGNRSSSRSSGRHVTSSQWITTSRFSLSCSHVHPPVHPALLYILPLILHPFCTLASDWLVQAKEAVSKWHQEQGRVGHRVWPSR
ncbi:hypothetical protein INR49_011376 [Caranx melampygus]|nr:hypothetical protein INR49_011376 [Caranx melampygus]